MEYNEEKKCVVAYVISSFFLFEVIISVLFFSVFWGSIFPRWRYVSSYLFFFFSSSSYCDLFDFLWLFTPFHTSIG